MNQEQLKKSLNLGQIAQIGFVVRDLSKSIENYEKAIGIGPFTILDIPHGKIATTQLTPQLALELIEGDSGETFHRDFLEKHGEGVQHLGFMTDECDEVLKRAESIGIEILMRVEADVPHMGHVKAAYLDTYDLMGVVVEIIEVKPF
ncbi:MAG: VOC family protein [Pseudomonadota bacterium]